MNKQLLYNDCLSEFKRTFFKEALTRDHLVNEEKFFKEFIDVTGETVIVNKFYYVLHKNGKKYLLESKFVKDLPLEVNKSDKVAYRNDAYTLIEGFDSLKFRPTKHYSFKEFIDTLASFDHSNQPHHVLSKIIVVMQMMDRANIRICTNPGFGKDSGVDLMGNLFGPAVTVENPTLAKLEYLSTYLKLLAVNEVVDIGKAELRSIEQYLLAAGAFKPDFTKHSRALNGGKEVIDISGLSLTLMYNDITDYTDHENYFDFVVKKAIIDRFPPLRLYGDYQEPFNNISGMNVPKVVKDNIPEYRKLLETYAYFDDHYMSELSKYSNDFSSHPQRWKTNLGRLARFVDLYSESQSEFDDWMMVIEDSMQDYKDMLTYPSLVAQGIKKGSKEWETSILPLVNKAKTFTGKKIIINRYLAGVKQMDGIKSLNKW